MAKLFPPAALLVLVLAAGRLTAAEDILVADFEGDSYGDWKATGEAFGPGPARGTLPNQMDVTGYLGKGLVNSYYKGDASTGTLTSPPLSLQRPYLSFLVGGGRHPGQTCLNLLVGGQVVRTATGPNDKPGGSERLDWCSWDVRDLQGQQAVLQIVDRATGGWGHVNIDHILQTDRPRGVVQTVRDLSLDRDFLTFTFAPGQGPRHRIALLVDGRPVRQAAATGRPQPSTLTWDISRLKGQKAQLHVEEQPTPDGKTPLAASISLSDKPKGALIVTDRVYRETYRPQFHFTPRTNWTNDPNGLVWYKGEYHLFFQHNPTGINWGNMTWGHAVSPDLVHWKQLDHALHPDKLGTIFSGSAVVDDANTGGFPAGPEKPIVCIYTSAGKPFTQSIAWSTDRGRTWTKFAGNPVLGHVRAENRDPKVFWHEPTKRWVMALYLDQSDYALFGSPDLKKWTKLSDVALPGASECPDFFPLAVDGDPTRVKWVFWGANGTYRLGSFDGTTFKPETNSLKSLAGANDYAAQTYSDIPSADGRRIQIAWMSGGRYPDMPFNQQMTFPRVLSLRSSPDGPRLAMAPVREIEQLRTRTHKWTALDLKPGDNPLSTLDGDLWDIEADLEPGRATGLVLTVRGEPIRWEAKSGTLTALGRTAPLKPSGGRLSLRVLVDRTSVEIFADDGRLVMCSCFVPDPADRTLALTAEGAPARIASLKVHALKSAWE